MRFARVSMAWTAIVFTAGLLVIPTPAIGADDPRAIMQESDKRSDARSQRYEGVLQVTDAGGRTSEKRWVFQRLGSHGRSKTTIRFTAPAEVRGVALLIVSHPNKASDQWMWTPAIERDRRIAMQDRSTRFFGTDFSFEDLEERDVDQYTYTMLGDEAVDGAPCWKIQAVARQTKSSQYSKSILWVRKDSYTIVRIESYVKDELARRLSYSELRPVQGFVTAHELTMQDIKRKSTTKLTLNKVEYDVNLSDRAFTLEALRRQ